jgi:predicted neutral ceramidase superfamily lipid hydrolase
MRHYICLAASLLLVLLDNKTSRILEGEVQMRRFHLLAIAGALIVTAFVATACTSTAQSRNAGMPLNSACAYGFDNDRPCSY